MKHDGGRAERDSALTRNKSHILAESLTNLVESESEKFSLDESISVIRENVPETNISSGDREIFESIVNELNSASGEDVINNLVKQFSLKRLTHLRDVLTKLCRETWKDCPTGKLVRRVARTGGAKVETKFATDIVELLKFWKLGEIIQQLSEMFVKGNFVKSDSSQALLTDSGSAEVENEFLPKMVEKLEADISRACFEMKSLVNELKCEVERLNDKLLQRDAKICELESKLTSLQSRRKVELERQRSLCDDYELEINVVKKQMSGLTKDVESLKSKIQKINHSADVPGELERTNVGTNNGINRQHTNIVMDDACSKNRNLISRNTSEATGNNTETGMQRSFSDVVASVAGFAAQSSKAKQHLYLGPKNDSAGMAQTVGINREAVSELETEHADVEFVGVRKLNIKRVYLGGVKEGVNEGKIRQFMENKGVIPTFIRILKSRRKGTIAVRVNVKYENFDQVCKNDFWPTNIYARPWISGRKWGDRDIKRPDRQLSQHQNE